MFIDWRYDDELLELAEAIDASHLLFLHMDFSPRLVIDIGASCGISSFLLLAQASGGTMVSYEPRPDAFERLERRMRPFRQRVRPLPLAVSSTDGALQFVDRGVGTARGSGVGGFRAQTVGVAAIARGLVDELVVKIDIEGGEGELLPLLAPHLPARSILLVETHHDLDCVRVYSQAMRDRGFRWKLLRHRDLPEYGGPFLDWMVLGPGIQDPPVQ
jgi:FkbM family methyltransferase